MHNETEHEKPTHYSVNGKNLQSFAYLISASVLISALLISGTLFYTLKSGVGTASAGTAGAAAAKPVALAVKPNTPFIGGADAKVTVVEYADYRCPFCERWYTSVMPELKTKYIDSGKIKFIYQDFAFLGPDSNSAAEASHCAADQNMFWQYHDYLFGHQGDESGHWASVPNLKQFASTLGLNTTQFNTCLDSGKYKQEVLDETAAGKKYGVTGTPTVFVNGVPIVGAQPLQTFVDAIDAALKK
ncbi:MAG: DsbA family protein [Patescibacteria group bacterium]